MSNYGNPPSAPHGQNPQDPAVGGAQPQAPYAQPTQGGYGATPQTGYPGNPYGGSTQVGTAFGIPPGVSLASWGQRVGAALLDGLVAMLTFLPFMLGVIMFVATIDTTTDPITGEVTSEMTGGAGPAVAFMVLGFLLAFAFGIWNSIFKQGNTGYTIGKGIVGIKLIKAETGQPLGVGMTFLRYIVTQAIGSATCGIGSMVDLLWPLGDEKNQTLHDKVVGSLVIQQPKA